MKNLFVNGSTVLGGFFVAAILSAVMVGATFAVGGVDKITINLPTSCTIESTNNTHTETLINNTYDDNVGNGITTFTTYCNDVGGYIIYAIGSSGNEEGNTNLVGNNGTNIATGTLTQGDTSNWAFRIGSLDNTLTMNPTYTSGDNFAKIPSTWDWVAKKESGTVDITTGSKTTAQYAAYISGTQQAGTYEGRVKYVMLHPSTSSAPVGIEGIVYMQEFAGLTSAEKASLLDTMIEDQQYKLKDIRDGKEYWVAKLKDGNVWMTENLDFDLSTEQALTSDDTDLNLYGSYGYNSDNGYSCSNSNNNCEGGVISFTPERDTIASNNLDSTTWHNDNNNPYSWQGNGACPESSDSDCNDGHSYANNYYNWTAAIASNNSSAYTTGSTVAANSICPAGWRLPTDYYSVGGYGEISQLLVSYNIISDPDRGGHNYEVGGFGRIIDNPLYFVRSGNTDGGILYNLGIYGNYQTNRVISSSPSIMYFNSDGVVVGGGGRASGFSVRCIVK